MTTSPAQVDAGRNVPLDFDPLSQMLRLVRIRLDPFCLELPSEQDVARHWKDLGVSAPLPSEDDMRKLEEKVWSTLPRLRHNLSGRNLRLAKAAAHGSAPVDKVSMTWEVRVRELSWPQLVELAEANGIQPSSSSNPGLRTMQTRNSLYALIRKNGHLDEVPTSWSVHEGSPEATTHH